jgi:phi13 family phage major tail protein
MAKIGLNNFKFGVLTEAAGGVVTYGAMQSLGKAVDANVSITNNSAVLYADDVIAESDNTFSAGTITLTVDDDDNTVFAVLLGHEIDSSTQEMIRNSNDTPPYVGVGRIINKLKNGTRLYKVEFLSKVKFGEPNQESATHGETTEFGTQQIEGTIVTLASGEWSKTKTFTTHSAALAYLASCFGQTITAETFAGDGTTAAFTLTNTPATIFTVTVNGTPTTEYSVANKVLTFDSAPADSAVIYVSYGYNA